MNNILTLHVTPHAPEHAYQKGFAELELAGKLAYELMNTVQPLQKHWATLGAVLRTMTAAISKLVAIRQPLPLNQHSKTLQKKEKSFYKLQEI